MFSSIERRRFLYGIGLAVLPVATGRTWANDGKDGGFRAEVMALVRKRYPGKTVEEGADPMSIKIGGIDISLDNIRKNALGLTGRARRDTILEAIDALVKTDVADRPSVGFASVKTRLRIQIAPADFAAIDGIRIFSRVLSKKTMEAVVIDEDGTYRYVTEDDVKTWGVPPATILQRGIDNLDVASIKVHIDVFSGAGAGDRCVILNLPDGYCAARVLCPKFMFSLHQKLAEKVYFTVPARDFLLAWTDSFSKASLLIRQAGQLYEQMDHPLTREIFVSEHGKIRLASVDEIQAMSHG